METTTPCDESVSVAPSYDCSALVQYAARAEIDFASIRASRSVSTTATNFGHPEPPSISLVVHAIIRDPARPEETSIGAASSLLPGCSILVAYTHHTVSAQLFSGTKAAEAEVPNADATFQSRVSDKVQEICILVPDDVDVNSTDDTADDAMDETIACLTVVPFPQSSTSRAASLLSSSSSSLSITSSSSLLKGVVHRPPAEATMDSMDGSKSISGATTVKSIVDTTTNSREYHQQRLVIVFGTTQGRLYAVEIVVSSECDTTTTARTVTLERHYMLDETTHTRSSLFQVFPLDETMSNHSRRRARHKTSWKQRFSTGASTGSSIRQPSFPVASTSTETATTTPFCPTGGVVSVTMYNSPTITSSRSSSSHCHAPFVWIVYGDSTMLRVHAAALFPSTWQIAATHGRSVEDECSRMVPTTTTAAASTTSSSSACSDMPTTTILVRCRVVASVEEARYHEPILIVPLPRHVPAPLTPLATLLLLNSRSETSPSSSLDYTRENVDTIYEALVFGQGPNHVLPTFGFYSSERPWDSQLEAAENRKSTQKAAIDPNQPGMGNSEEGRILESVTKALVGSAIGALRWGLGGSSSVRNLLDSSRHGGIDNRSTHGRSAPSKLDSSRHGSTSNETEEDGNDAATTPFPSIWKAPVELRPSIAFHDAPRKIEFCSIDPDGNLAAATDGLGRVLLIDLSTKHLVRMWKGYREASCYWLQTVPARHADEAAVAASPYQQSRRRKPLLHLVIHSRQRRVVEVWRVRHGSRVFSTSVGRDSRVVPFSSWSPALSVPLACCYLIHLKVTEANQLELIQINEQAFESMDTSSYMATPPQSVASAVDAASVASTPSKTNALRLKRLQQLLTAGNIIYSKEDVQNALHEIKSLTDLSVSLDLLAVGSLLEERFGVIGSSFQKEALTYCRSILSAAVMRGKSRSDATSRENPYIQILSHKIEYHTQIVKAFDAIHKFESIQHEVAHQQAKAPSHWAAEAMAWASTYEQATGESLDEDASMKSQETILFSEFASRCAFPEFSTKLKGPSKIFFSESTRTRRDVIAHVFKPLLADIFSFNVVYSVFDSLGTRDSQYVQQCFGEWFMTLSVREAYSKGLYCEAPPMLRLLQDLVSRELAVRPISEITVVLGVLLRFCEESSDLIRAFMLGALCLEAVSKAANQKDRKHSGKIQNTKIVDGWKSMLRKLRVCLLVSLRMHGIRLAAPITIDTVEDANTFSIYEWLARDELAMSHNHEEIASLEKACSISSYSFDPSLPDGDGPSRFKMLQNSCLSAAISEEERAEYLMDFNDDDKFGALLLFLSSHNEPKILAAHRALLLSSEWGTKPEKLVILQDALVALKSLYRTPGFVALALAVCLSIWQSQLCPIYRCFLFGFADVHQVNEDVISPLLETRAWLTTVGQIGLQLLAIIKECKLDDQPDAVLRGGDVRGGSWPPVRPDVVLNRLVGKTQQKTNESALEAHSVVLCALLVSDNADSLIQCVPTIHDLFMSNSLFKQVSSSSNVQELQQTYLNDAVLQFASQYTGPSMDNFDLGEIETLAKVWSFDLNEVRTIFLLAMYDLGKDRLVDDLVTKATFQIDIPRFVEDGVSIACRRLNVFLSESRVHSTGMRNVIGLLDANLCEWIKERAADTAPMVSNPELFVAIGSTNAFVMRLLSLSASSECAAGLRLKIHSLVVFNGILAKALR